MSKKSRLNPFSKLTKSTQGKYAISKFENLMDEYGFDSAVKEEVVKVLQAQLDKYNKEEFTKWCENLNYKCPDEFTDESYGITLYEQSKDFFDREIIKLEEETKLSWLEQSEDLYMLDESARKVQLVIRHRLTEMVLDLKDK